MDPIYRPVPGYADLYAGMDGSIVKAGHGMLKQHECAKYVYVNIPGQKPNSRAVHVLVAAAFLGERPTGMVVRHGGTGQFDNSIGNLCYGTQKDNLGDSIACGTHQSVANSKKTHCSRGHLYSPENTYITPSTGGRLCRICQKAQHRVRHAERARGDK